MNPKTRRLLILFLFILFIFLGGGFVLYAQGYRIDFKNFQVLKAGAIYVKTYPYKADIFLNNKLINRGFSLFDSGVLINSLFPKKYFLEIKMDGYQDWKRSVIVKPSLVSEVKYAVLVPKQENSILKDDIKHFFIFPDENFLILNSKNQIIFNLNTLQGNKIEDISSDFNNILTYDFKNKNYWVNNIRNNNFINLNLAIKRFNSKFDFEKILFTKENPDELVFWNKNSVGLFNLNKNNFNIIKNGNVTSSLLINNIDSFKIWLAWSEFDDKNNISNFYTFQKTNKKINQFILPFKNIKLLIKNNNLFLLQNDGSLYRHNLVSNVTFKIATDVKNFYLNNSGEMIAVLESNALEIFNLKDQKDYFRFNMPESKDILKIEWFRDGRHIFLFFKNSIKFMEIEDLYKENIKTIVSDLNINEYNATYDFKLNKLYFIKNDTLNYIEFPEV